MAHFAEAQNSYMLRLQVVIGGCPAVPTPRQHKQTRGGPKLLRALEQVVDTADAPMWLPGDCANSTPIITRGPGTGNLAMAILVPPKTQEWDTQYGKVQTVEIPGQLYNAAIHKRGHHLGDLLEEGKRVPDINKMRKRWPGKTSLTALIQWMKRHMRQIRRILNDAEAN